MSNKKRHKTRREARQFEDQSDRFWSAWKPVFYKQLQVRSGLYDRFFTPDAKGRRNIQQTRIKGVSRHDAEDMVLVWSA